jgi:serine/threonine protein kinase
MCGTPDYFAPEVILNQGHNVAADWWALGVLMYATPKNSLLCGFTQTCRYELLVGTPPFYSEDRMTVYKQALSGKISFPSHVSRFARHLISQFLQTAPSKRIGNLRGGVADVKGHPFFKDFDWVALETRQMVCVFLACPSFLKFFFCHFSHAFLSAMPHAVRNCR